MGELARTRCTRSSHASAGNALERERERERGRFRGLVLAQMPMRFHTLIRTRVRSHHTPIRAVCNINRNPPLIGERISKGQRTLARQATIREYVARFPINESENDKGGGEITAREIAASKGSSGAKGGRTYGCRQTQEPRFAARGRSEGEGGGLR